MSSVCAVEVDAKLCLGRNNEQGNKSTIQVAYHIDILCLSLGNIWWYLRQDRRRLDGGHGVGECE